ncbi:MAG: S41 family peptidase [Anaerolineales bacterium]|jgi:C-terminal processing protease CtpA/Prc
MNPNKNSIDPIICKELIHKLCEKLTNYYIFPDIAKKLCIILRKNLEAGEYDDISEGEFLALALTTHMQEVSQDKHLWVRWHEEFLPEDHGTSLLQNPIKVEELKAGAKLKNFGIFKVERLPGNVGYIDIRYFYRTSWGSGETITAAMHLLANTQAVIIDLRKCGGGNPGAVLLVSSYFFQGEPIHLNSLYWREGEVTEQYWTLPHVPGVRMHDQPVYILTGKKTFSAGEEFAYNFQALERATLIGETTLGGAHPGSPYRLQAHFEVFIPNGRAINPITGGNWEGTGVQPDIPLPEEDALDKAYQMALETVIKSLQHAASIPEKKLLEEARDALKRMDTKE